MKYKLSIILPVYNCENVINRCIDSILASTYKNIELIIINDCSSDNSLNLISEYKVNDNVQIINLIENRGVSYCRNLGIQSSTGDYITFIDGDDYITSSMYDNMMTKIINNNVDCCVCDYAEVFPDAEMQKSKYLYNNNILVGNEILRSYLTDKISPAIWDKIFKAEILRDGLKFESGLQVGEDILFCLKYFTNIQSVYLLNQVHYYYEQQPSSVMHTISPKLLQFREIVNSISKVDLDNYKKDMNLEFKYFDSAMMMRGIHSYTVLSNKENKRQVLQYMKQFYDKEKLKNLLRSPYTSKFIKVEVLILYLFGVNFHLYLKPVYVKGRKVLRGLKLRGIK